MSLCVIAVCSEMITRKMKPEAHTGEGDCILGNREGNTMKTDWTSIFKISSLTLAINMFPSIFLNNGRCYIITHYLHRICPTYLYQVNIGKAFQFFFFCCCTVGMERSWCHVYPSHILGERMLLIKQGFLIAALQYLLNEHQGLLHLPCLFLFLIWGWLKRCGTFYK